MLPLPARSTPWRLGGAVLLTGTLAATLAACAPQNPSGQQLGGEEGKVQDVVERFATRAGDDDAAGICRDILTADLAQRIGRGTDCTPAVKTLIRSTDITTLPVDSVRVQGNTAVATIVRAKQSTPQTKIVLRRTAGQPWKIAAFGNKAAASAISTTPSSTTPGSTTPGTSPT